MEPRSCKMSNERLEHKREHAAFQPDGRTAEMVNHIDWMIETVRRAKLEYLAGRYDNMEKLLDEIISMAHTKL